MQSVHFIMLISVIVFIASLYRLERYPCADWIPLYIILTILMPLVFIISTVVSFMKPMKYEIVTPNSVTITKAKKEVVVETDDYTFHLHDIADLEILKAKSVKIKKKFNSWGIELNDKVLVWE